ncbi:MAG: polyhydroxyalkanoate synthesis regulator DNA-binding domain-containing protein [Limisphaerales bacterium]
MKHGDNAEKKLEIKKYANRRYYDATHSRHLTLDEIRSLIHEGYDIRVIDAKTSADITAQILTQIILELETRKLDSLPVPLLVRIIRVNDQLVKDFVERYFNQALQSFLDYQRQLEEQLRRAHRLPAAVPSVADWTKAMIEPWTKALSVPPASEADDQSLREMVLKLQKEMRNLKQQGKRRKRR